MPYLHVISQSSEYHHEDINEGIYLPGGSEIDIMQAIADVVDTDFHEHLGRHSVDYFVQHRGEKRPVYDSVYVDDLWDEVDRLELVRDLETGKKTLIDVLMSNTPFLRHEIIQRLRIELAAEALDI